MVFSEILGIIYYDCYNITTFCMSFFQNLLMQSPVDQTG
jgi:hypothetical protein